MTIAIWIISWIVTPFIIFGINDYYSGLFEDRFDENLSIYGNHIEGDIIFLIHIIWPVFAIFMVGLWIYHIVNYKFNICSLYNLGKEQHRKDTDIDAIADKYLLGKNDVDSK